MKSILKLDGFQNSAQPGDIFVRRQQSLSYLIKNHHEFLKAWDTGLTDIFLGDKHTAPIIRIALIVPDYPSLNSSIITHTFCVSCFT